ncbi:MAG: hypothetical protein H7A23_18810 [Leptospiraceae bacterium]|nr:hypothetical protein [Leptospiraceae bacterium]
MFNSVRLSNWLLYSDTFEEAIHYLKSVKKPLRLSQDYKTLSFSKPFTHKLLL